MLTKVLSERVIFKPRSEGWRVSHERRGEVGFQVKKMVYANVLCLGWSYKTQGTKEARTAGAWRSRWTWETAGEEWDPGREAWMSVGLYAADNGDHLKVLEQNNRITVVCGKLELGLLRNRRGQGDQTGSQEVSLDGHWHPWPEVYEGQMEEAFRGRITWFDHWQQWMAKKWEELEVSPCLQPGFLGEWWVDEQQEETAGWEGLGRKMKNHHLDSLSRSPCPSFLRAIPHRSPNTRGLPSLHPLKTEHSRVNPTERPKIKQETSFLSLPAVPWCSRFQWPNLSRANIFLRKSFLVNFHIESPLPVLLSQTRKSHL